MGECHMYAISCENHQSKILTLVLGLPKWIRVKQKRFGRRSYDVLTVICWFGAQETFLLVISVKWASCLIQWSLEVFLKVWTIAFILNKNLCNIINIFTVTFDQFNASLLEDSATLWENNQINIIWMSPSCTIETKVSPPSSKSTFLPLVTQESKWFNVNDYHRVLYMFSIIWNGSVQLAQTSHFQISN